MNEYAMVRPGYRIKAERGQHQAQYYDTYVKVWYDLGDPKDTREQAQAAIAEHHERALQSVRLAAPMTHRRGTFNSASSRGKGKR